MNKSILVALPHPDDEVFPMSGTLYKMINEGYKVTYACLTLGQMGRNLGNPAFANRVNLPEVREKELKKSCEIIGIQDLRMLGFHDKTIEFEPFDYIDGVLKDIIDEVQPKFIITHYPKYGVHPDHDACGAAIIRIVGRMKPEDRPTMMCIAYPDMDEIGKPDIVNDISEYMHIKIASMKAHSSQFKYFEKESEDAKTKDHFYRRMSRERFWHFPFDK